MVVCRAKTIVEIQPWKVAQTKYSLINSIHPTVQKKLESELLKEIDDFICKTTSKPTNDEVSVVKKFCSRPLYGIKR